MHVHSNHIYVIRIEISLENCFNLKTFCSNSQIRINTKKVSSQNWHFCTFMLIKFLVLTLLSLSFYLFCPWKITTLKSRILLQDWRNVPLLPKQTKTASILEIWPFSHLFLCISGFFPFNRKGFHPKHTNWIITQPRCNFHGSFNLKCKCILTGCILCHTYIEFPNCYWNYYIVEISRQLMKWKVNIINRLVFNLLWVISFIL